MVERSLFIFVDPRFTVKKQDFYVDVCTVNHKNDNCDKNVK